MISPRPLPRFFGSCFLTLATRPPQILISGRNAGYFPNRFLVAMMSAVGMFCVGVSTLMAQQAEEQRSSALQQRAQELLAEDNLVAWCIVPFDSQKRGPEARAQMLNDLKIRRCAYDWREEHVAEFEQEILAYQKHGITYEAFWDYHPQAFALFRKYELSPDIWKMIPDPGEAAGDQRLAQAVQLLLPLAQETAEMNCRLSLYNHGGWAGSPETMIQVCQKLRDQGHTHVGIVWNFHHGHDYIENWPEVFQQLLPYLHCLNINGMNTAAQPKILPVGKGEHEQSMFRTVLESDYDGRIGILDHLPEEDSRQVLQGNLNGVVKLRQAFGKPPSDLNQQTSSVIPPNHSEAHVHLLAGMATEQASSSRGVQVFAANRFACLSCHRVDQFGGKVGPALTDIGATRSVPELVSSVLWPNHQVETRYRQLQVLTLDGRVRRGIVQNRSDGELKLLDPATQQVETIREDDIDEEALLGSVMPEGMGSAMTLQQIADLVRFLSELGNGGETFQEELRLAFAHSHPHQSLPFPYQTSPAHPELWPNHADPVNRQRIYDFYSQQADYYRARRSVPLLLEAFHSLDGPETGHWGNQDENTWRDDRWNRMELGGRLAGVTRIGNQVVSRGLNVQMTNGVSFCYDLDRLAPRAWWTGGFLRFSDTRHGFMDALMPVGEVQILPGDSGQESGHLLGYYPHDDSVVVAIEANQQRFLERFSFQNQELRCERITESDARWQEWIQPSAPQWPQTYTSKVTLGSSDSAYEVDTIALPAAPGDPLFFLTGLDFLKDGSAVICTMQGEVWHVDGFAFRQPDHESQPPTARWRKIASGLHQPLGLKIIDDQIYVQCRDQLMELIDQNQDLEIDYYRCVNNAFVTSPAGHDYICGLQADAEGNFYTASGNQGLLKLSPDGQSAEVLATGFRNPDGLGRLPDGTLTVPCSEGDWTPASMVCAVRPNQSGTPHFGYQGPRNGQPPQLPWYYLPRGLDNSSAEQIWCDSPNWGPASQHPIHLSFGMGRTFYVLPDSQHPQQAAICALPGDFLSGIHRGRFHPTDGQLYVVGMSGWGTYTPADGCFQRLRYTGKPVLAPAEYQVHENGVCIKFNGPLSASMVEDADKHFAQCWNYRYSQGYGSAELSTTHPGMVGHDHLTILSTHLLDDEQTLFLEIPDLQPTSQLHLNLQIGQPTLMKNAGVDLWATVHQLSPPFTSFPGYRKRPKTVAVHPMFVDMQLLSEKIENPFTKPLPDARPLRVVTGQNLTYQTTELRVQTGEKIKLTLENPDVVPHNWVLVRPGQLAKVGQASNRLIAEPTAAAHQYVPDLEEVLVHTDVVPGGQEFTVYFQAPAQPGIYPYLCTFPGHWMVMNGTLIVE